MLSLVGLAFIFGVGVLGGYLLRDWLKRWVAKPAPKAPAPPKEEPPLDPEDREKLLALIEAHAITADRPSHRDYVMAGMYGGYTLPSPTWEVVNHGIPNISIFGCKTAAEAYRKYCAAQRVADAIKAEEGAQ